MASASWVDGESLHRLVSERVVATPLRADRPGWLDLGLMLTLAVTGPLGVFALEMGLDRGLTTVLWAATVLAAASLALGRRLNGLPDLRVMPEFAACGAEPHGAPARRRTPTLPLIIPERHVKERRTPRRPLALGHTHRAGRVNAPPAAE